MGRKKISEGGSMPKSAWKTAPPTACKPGEQRNLVYDDDVRQRIIDLLWSGDCKSITEISRLDGMPSRSNIYVWRDRHPEFAAELDRAQRALGDIYMDDVHTIVRQVREGALDPNAARVALHASFRLAEITDPRTYANKSYVEKNETVNVRTTHVNRIEIDGLSDEQLDALENALQAKLLTGPDGVSDTAGED